MDENRPVISITGKKVALGPLRKDLIPTYDRWYNDAEAAFSYYRGYLRPDTQEETESRYEAMKKDVAFTIYETGSMRPIGTVELTEVDFFNRTCAFGIVIGEAEFRSRGFGTEATSLALDWAFHALGLHSVRLTVFSFNRRGIRAYEKAGFKVAGRLRESKRVADKLYDTIYMDCLATEFAGESALRSVMPG